MSLINDRERQVLILEYETLHKENWERGQNVWLVNSILITGSLIVSFQSAFEGSLPYLTSLFLVIMAFMTQATSDKVTAITYKKMERIREILGMTEPTTIYYCEIRWKWWYLIRRNVPYLLYLVLACVYLFLLLNDRYISIDVFMIGLFLIIAREIYDLANRDQDNS